MSGISTLEGGSDTVFVVLLFAGIVSALVTQLLAKVILVTKDLPGGGSGSPENGGGGSGRPRRSPARTRPMKKPTGIKDLLSLSHLREGRHSLRHVSALLIQGVVKIFQWYFLLLVVVRAAERGLLTASIAVSSILLLTVASRTWPFVHLFWTVRGLLFLTALFFYVQTMMVLVLFPSSSSSSFSDTTPGPRDSFGRRVNMVADESAGFETVAEMVMKDDDAASVGNMSSLAFHALATSGGSVLAEFAHEQRRLSNVFIPSSSSPRGANAKATTPLLEGLLRRGGLSLSSSSINSKPEIELVSTTMAAPIRYDNTAVSHARLATADPTSRGNVFTVLGNSVHLANVDLLFSSQDTPIFAVLGSAANLRNINLQLPQASEKLLLVITEDTKESGRGVTVNGLPLRAKGQEDSKHNNSPSSSSLVCEGVEGSKPQHFTIKSSSSSSSGEEESEKTIAVTLICIPDLASLNGAIQNVKRNYPEALSLSSLPSDGASSTSPLLIDRLLGDDLPWFAYLRAFYLPRLASINKIWMTALSAVQWVAPKFVSAIRGVLQLALSAIIFVIDLLKVLLSGTKDVGCGFVFGSEITSLQWIGRDHCCPSRVDTRTSSSSTGESSSAVASVVTAGGDERVKVLPPHCLGQQQPSQLQEASRFISALLCQTGLPWVFFILYWTFSSFLQVLGVVWSYSFGPLLHGLFSVGNYIFVECALLQVALVDPLVTLGSLILDGYSLYFITFLEVQLMWWNLFVELLSQALVLLGIAWDFGSAALSILIFDWYFETGTTATGIILGGQSGMVLLALYNLHKPKPKAHNTGNGVFAWISRTAAKTSGATGTFMSIVAKEGSGLVKYGYAMLLASSLLVASFFIPIRIIRIFLLHIVLPLQAHGAMLEVLHYPVPSLPLFGTKRGGEEEEAGGAADGGRTTMTKSSTSLQQIARSGSPILIPLLDLKNLLQPAFTRIILTIVAQWVVADVVQGLLWEAAKIVLMVIAGWVSLKVLGRYLAYKQQQQPTEQQTSSLSSSSSSGNTTAALAANSQEEKVASGTVRAAAGSTSPTTATITSYEKEDHAKVSADEDLVGRSEEKE